MPFTIRSTMNCKTNSYGFKETWFSQYNSNDLSAPFNYLYTVLAPKKNQIMGDQSSIVSCEVSVELDNGTPPQPVLGDSMLKDGPAGSALQADSADPDVALLLRCSNSTRQRRRNVFVRGIWDSIEIQGGRFSPGSATGAWQTYWNAYIAALQGMGDVGIQGAGWLRTDKNIITAINTYKNPVVSAIQDANGFVDITFMNNMTWPNGLNQRNKVRINTARVKSSLSGSLIVVPSSATLCKTAFPVAIFTQPTTAWYGYTVSVSFQTITFYDPERITVRRAGKISGVTPGRAKARPKG
jgi:hypothetical protein